MGQNEQEMSALVHGRRLSRTSIPHLPARPAIPALNPIPVLAPALIVAVIHAQLAPLFSFPILLLLSCLFLSLSLLLPMFLS